MRKVLNTISDFLGKTAARYKAYVERENAKLRAAATANAVMLAEQNMLGDYLTVAEIVARAVNNMAEADPNLIRRVTDISQITNPRAAIANRTLNGRAVFFWCFRLRLTTIYRSRWSMPFTQHKSAWTSSRPPTPSVLSSAHY